MAAELLIDERHVLDARTVVWQLPRPVRGSIHPFKYRLALVVDEICVLRYDNEAGKGDHRHIRNKERVIASLIPTHYSRISGATLKG
jgi:hypothetical protein